MKVCFFFVRREWCSAAQDAVRSAPGFSPFVMPSWFEDEATCLETTVVPSSSFVGGYSCRVFLWCYLGGWIGVISEDEQMRRTAERTRLYRQEPSISRHRTHIHPR